MTWDDVAYIGGLTYSITCLIILFTVFTVIIRETLFRREEDKINKVIKYRKTQEELALFNNVEEWRNDFN